MNALLISCHAVLEYQEMKTLSKIPDVHVFSLNGSYQNPQNPIEADKRPGIPWLQPNQQLNDLAIQCSRANIHDDLLKWANVVIIMHKLDWIGDGKEWLEDLIVRCRNFNTRIIWRTIGQSHSHWERLIKRYPEIKIVRYSPKERNIPGYAGEDALIRFGYSKDEFNNWYGGTNKVHVYGQSIKERGLFLGYPLIEEITRELPRVMYGTRNAPGEADKPEFAVSWAAGALNYENMKESYREADVALYTGTVPASYTLTFVEMLLTGTPLVCIGKNLFNCEKFFPGHDLYEVPDIIENGVNGFCSDSIVELKGYLAELLCNETLRKEISKAGRETAIKLFDEEVVRSQWQALLKTL